jgi:dTDP-glucose pyrophosphorylase
MIRKAVILAAGSASRMQEQLEQYVQKEDELDAIRMGEKMAARFKKIPFLDYQLLNLIEAGISEINIVLRPDDTFFTHHYTENGKILFPEAEISFSFQEVADGTAHAVLASAAFAGKDRFLVLNGDNHYPFESLAMLMNSPEYSLAMVAYDTAGFSTWTRKRLEAFAVIHTENGLLKRIVEKPQNPSEHVTDDHLYASGNRRVRIKAKNLASMNLWCFDHAVIEACMDIPRHEPRKAGKAGEYELPDAVELMLQRGREVMVYYACADILDLTRAEDIDVVGKKINEGLKASINKLNVRYSRIKK